MGSVWIAACATMTTSQRATPYYCGSDTQFSTLFRRELSPFLRLCGSQEYTFSAKDSKLKAWPCLLTIKFVIASREPAYLFSAMPKMQRRGMARSETIINASANEIRPKAHMLRRCLPIAERVGENRSRAKVNMEIFQLDA